MVHRDFSILQRKISGITTEESVESLEVSSRHQPLDGQRGSCWQMHYAISTPKRNVV